MATVTSLRVALSASYNDKKAFQRLRHDIRRTAEDQSFLTESTRRVSRAFMTVGPVAVPALAATAKAAASVGVAAGAAGAGVAIYVSAARNAYNKNQKVQKSYDDLKKVIDNFGFSARGAISQTMIQGYQTFETALRKLETVVPGVANAMARIGNEVSEFVNSPAFDRFVTWLSNNAPKAITSFWRAGVNLGKGLFTLLSRMGAFETSGFLNWLVNVTDRFKDWASSDAAGKLVKFFNDSGPVVGQFAMALARLAATVSTALGPLGLVVLKALTPILNWMAGFLSKNPWVVQGLWVLYAAMKALAFAKIVSQSLVLATASIAGLGRSVTWTATQVSLLSTRLGLMKLGFVTWAKNSKIMAGALKVLQFAFKWTGIQAAAAWVAALGPVAWIIAGIVAVGAAVVYAYNKFPWFRNAVNAVWNAILNVLKYVWQWIVNIFRNIGAVFGWLYRSVILPIGRGIAAAFRWIGSVWNWLYKNIIAPVGRAIGAVFSWIGRFVSNFWRIVKNVAYWVGAAIRVMAYLVWYGIKKVFGPAFSWAGRLVSNIGRWIAASARWIWAKITGAFNAVINFFRTAWRAAWNWMARLISNVLNWIRGRVATAVNNLRGWFNRIVGFFSRIFAPAWRWIERVIRNVLNWIRGRVNTAVTNLRNNFNRVINFFRKTFAPAWRWLARVVDNVWDWITNRVKSARDFIGKVFKRIRDGLSTVRKAFWNGAHAIGRAWNWMAEYAKKPIRWVINTVWNNGIRPVWNAVAKKIGVKKVDKVKGFAEGGVLPGYMAQKRDNMMVPMRAGEGVVVPEVVRALGPGFIHGLNALGNRGVGAVRSAAKRNGGNPLYNRTIRQRGGAEDQSPVDHILARMKPQGFALGGIIGKFAGWAKGDFIKKAYDKALGAVFNPMVKGTKQWGTNPDQMKAYPGFGGRFILGRVKAWLMSFLDRFSGGSAVVSAARSYLGKGDTTGDNSGNPFNAMWGYGDGTPWCANFVSAAVKKAGAGKFYPGYPTASVNTYYRNMKKVAFKNAKPGDLRTTGTSSHINIVESNMGGHKLRTIGGNQGPKVNRRTDSSGHVLRPKPGAPMTGGGAWFGKGTIPHGQRYGFLRQAMRMAGVKVTGAALKRWYRLIANESGWQPGRTNDWDINARNGNPSKGLAQIIRTTFDANKRKGWQWGNELHMTAAAMRYARRRYGDLSRTPLGGYADGGKMRQGELAMVGENGPELFRAGTGGGMVFPNSSLQGAAAAGGGTCTHIHFEDKVFVKNEQEFRKMVQDAVDKGKRRF